MYVEKQYIEKIERRLFQKMKRNIKITKIYTRNFTSEIDFLKFRKKRIAIYL